jgi:hypothetical protein
LQRREQNKIRWTKILLYDKINNIKYKKSTEGPAMKSVTALCACGKPGKRTLSCGISFHRADNHGYGLISEPAICCHSLLCLIKAGVKILFRLVWEETRRVWRYGKRDDATIYDEVPSDEDKNCSF